GRQRISNGTGFGMTFGLCCRLRPIVHRNRIPMRKTLLAAALLASLSACQKSEAPAPTASTDAAAAATTQADAAFADLSKRALEGWLQLSPVSATQIGEHKYDGELDDLSAE